MPSAGENDPAAGDDEVTDSEEMIGTSDHIQRQNPNSSGGEESRRMFQKLWTHADEMKVLQGFLDFTSKRGTTHANYQHDTGPFFDAIRPRLQFNFNKNQIAEKLRRLKKKYRNAAAKMESGRGFVFKSPHDRAAYDISRKIWSSTFYRKPKNRINHNDRSAGVGGGSEEAVVSAALVSSASASPVEEGGSVVPPPPAKAEAAAAGQSVEEEDAVRICLGPLFKEMVHFAVNGVTAAPPIAVEVEGDERWRRQRILELELYLKRMELVEEWVRSALAKLRSTGT